MTRFPFADRVRAVLFDAGNTLMWLDHARMSQILSSNGFARDEPSVRRAEMRARPRLDPFLASAVKRESAATIRRYIDLIVEELGSRAPPEAKDALEAAWPSLWSKPPADARSTLDALRARGLRVGVVSNSNGDVLSRLTSSGLADALECVVDSAIVGVEKPDPRIFAIGAERLSTPASECVYVGDFHGIDVLGARGAGMEAVLMDPIAAWVHVDAPKIASLGELLERL